MEKISVILILRNEEKNISGCLESVKWADEIVVVDQSSTDMTVEICKRYTDKVHITGAKGFCEPDRPLAVAKAKNDWILYVDADEEVPPELRSEIETILSEGPSFDSYFIPRKNILLGKWIKGSGWYPGYVLRLFKKGRAVFPDEIHRDIRPVGACGYLKESIVHHTCEDLPGYMKKVDRYTEIMARQMYSKGGRIGPGNILYRCVIAPCAYAFYKFFLKKGFIDGRRGMIIAFLTFHTVFTANLKLFKLTSGQRADG